MAAPVIRLENVSLCYRLAKQRHSSIKEFAIFWLKGHLRYEKLWALRNVDLEIAPGEQVSVIGRNGAGKSSLLKVISGVLKPTVGTVELRGGVAPILELGTGFDYELTGLENIYLNALLLGHKRREIEAVLPQIVEFSGIADFLDSPIRNYSSGMLARLGFSVATAWVPEVLLLDEVLSVGDAWFIQRCRQRIAELRRSGAAVILVSHDLLAVRESSERCLWLDRGVVRADGPTEEVVERYLASTDAGDGRGAGEPEAPAASG